MEILGADSNENASERPFLAPRKAMVTLLYDVRTRAGRVCQQMQKAFSLKATAPGIPRRACPQIMNSKDFARV
jgi:hypothetical protein